MRRREKVQRRGFPRKKQPPIDRRGEGRAVAGVAGEGVRIRAASEGVMGPARFRQRL